MPRFLITSNLTGFSNLSGLVLYLAEIMNILFFGYWGANEGLSQSTINPHLEILANFDKVQKIIYVSIERAQSSGFKIPQSPKIIHCPYYSIGKNRFLSKFGDFLGIPFFLKSLIKKENADLLMSRSSLAGGIAYLTSYLIKIPYTVESFEPHADYMKELNIWPSNGISYKFQKWLEQKQKKRASHIMPVSVKYKYQLEKEGVPTSKVSVMPCAVDIDIFRFSELDRKMIREKMKIEAEAIVGIYVGKFGGIYWDREAFKVFRSAFDYFDKFKLILLNNQDKLFISERFREVSIPKNAVHHLSVEHHEVPKYLTAADLAFTFHKPIPSAIAFSPIKNGEYWANGLPTISTSDIGDDSDLIKKHKIGLIANDDLSIKWSDLKLNSSDRNDSTETQVASEYRNFATTRSIYLRLLQA